MKYCRGILCVVAAYGLLQAAPVPTYKFEIIQPPGTSGGATALNNLGDVLISANEDTYLFHRGRYTLIRTALGNAAMGLGVNARGTVVGFADVPEGFVRTKSGEFLTFQFPAEQAPTGINDRGDIVGAGLGGSFIRYVNGVVETFRYQNDPNTYAYAINNRRQTAVQIWKPFWTDSYIREPDGTFKYIDIPGSIDTQVFGINDFGDVSGGIADESGIHGFVRHWYGAVSILDVPGARATSAWGINDWGQVAGLAVLRDNEQYVAFLATPDWHVRDGSRYLKQKSIRLPK
jgi:hypothetical protein